MDQQEQDALAQDARRLGEYITLLLEAADIPEEEKIAFGALLPEMTPEQIDRLIKVLEANVHDNEPNTTELRQKLDAVNEKYAAQEQAITEETLKDLDEIEQFIKDQEPKV